MGFWGFGVLAMKFAAIGPIAVHLPEKVEDNDSLGAQFPKWDMPLIFTKTGIRQRHIAAPDECASDLGVAAAERLFREYDIDRSTIDFLLFCTQTPDYVLPTTACLMQDRLGLPTSIGALDFNLGCSGFVYGLSLADGLIRSGIARRVLLITAETYSKYIDPTDRSLRTIFGDGAAATLIEAVGRAVAGLVRLRHRRPRRRHADGHRRRRPAQDQAIQPRKRKRWPSSLYMDGPELVKFSLEVVPPLIDRVLAAAKWTRDNVDLYLLHQATLFMLDHLRERLSLDREHTPEAMEEYGNTVSSTIPILIRDLRQTGRLKPGKQTLLVGFGVGLSWAGCVWTETWSQRQVESAGKAAAEALAPLPAETPAESKEKDADSADSNAEDPDKCLEAA